MARRTPTIANASQLLALSQQMQNQQLPQQLNYEYAQQLQQANAANDYRYQQGLGELAALRGRSMADVANVGAQQSADINQQFGQRLATQNQDLSRRGLMGSTITTSNARTLGEGQAAAQNRLAEQMALLRQNTDSQATGNLVNFIERRNDVAPEMSSLMQLQQGLGAAGVTGAGFGNMGPGSGGAGMAGRVPMAGGLSPSGFGNAAGIGHMGPGSGGAGSSIGRPAGGGAYGSISNMGPGSGGAGSSVGGVFGTGYPTINNGVVQNPWMTPVAGLNQGQQSPAPGLQGRRYDAGSADPYTMLLQAIRGGDGGSGGSSRSAPMIRTAGDINNSPLDMNGRMVNKPRNPAFYGTNAPAYQITMPGGFNGFQSAGGQYGPPVFHMGPGSGGAGGGGGGYYERSRRRSGTSQGSSGSMMGSAWGLVSGVPNAIAGGIANLGSSLNSLAGYMPNLPSSPRLVKSGPHFIPKGTGNFPFANYNR